MGKDTLPFFQSASWFEDDFGIVKRRFGTYRVSAKHAQQIEKNALTFIKGIVFLRNFFPCCNFY